MMAWAVPAIAEQGDRSANMDMQTININTATQAELVSLEGIGETYADRIIQYRQQNGSFQSPEDILKVKGIGQKTYEAMKDRIVVEDQKDK